jgi:hypothetical protein
MIKIILLLKTYFIKLSPLAVKLQMSSNLSNSILKLIKIIKIKQLIKEKH